jgi:ABC-2 type transport system ATP-binding protein
MSVVAARGLVKRFDDTMAVAGVDLTVEAGEIHGMVGPNGAGKTTVLGMLLGLVVPDEGTLRVFGRTWAEQGHRVLDGVAGFIENPRFYPYLTARRNLALLAGLDRPIATGRIAEALALAGLDGDNNSRVGGYSLGMRQRLGLAAALLRNPRLLILDEPANGLDPAGIRDIRAMIRRLADEGITVLLSSHNMDEVEDLCDNVTIMRTGSVVFDGSINDLHALAPDPTFYLRTSEDERAVALARNVPGVAIESHSASGLIVHAQRDRLDAYAIELGRGGVAIRSLELTTRPLEALFFTLTESQPESTRDRVPEVV